MEIYMQPKLSVPTSAIAGQVLCEIRKLKKINQTNVAEKLGISVSGLSKIETGATSLSLEQLFLFSEIYEQSEEEIIKKIKDIIYKLQNSGVVVTNSKSNGKKSDELHLSKSIWWLNLIE